MTNDELIDELLSGGFFSEYLPDIFTTNKLEKTILDHKFKSHLTKPFLFTMWKGNNGDRRYIAIPNVFSYLNVLKWIKNNPNIMSELINKNLSSSHSVSKIVTADNKLRKFNLYYPNEKYKINLKNNLKNDYINNLKIKMQKTNGCNCILHLDIANFFGSIYTHFFASISHGVDWAQSEFEKNKNCWSEEYKKYRSLDKRIRYMNRNRTNGIICGPQLSYVMAEFLQTQIDEELETALKGICDFTRYVDDYDFFIRNKKDIEIIKPKISEVLNKYGLSLNVDKTEVEEFPFYANINFDNIHCTNDALDDYSIFAKIEQNNQKGGLCYYINKLIANNSYDNEIALPIVLNIMKNVPEIMVSTCNYFLEKKYKDENEVVKILNKLLKEFVASKYDLESAWLCFIILKIDKNYIFDNYLISQLNDLSKLVVYSLSQNESNKEIIKSFKSDNWLFNYQMFYDDIISEDEFKSNLNLSDSMFMDYKYLKEQNISFIDATL